MAIRRNVEQRFAKLLRANFFPFYGVVFAGKLIAVRVGGCLDIKLFLNAEFR